MMDHCKTVKLTNEISTGEFASFLEDYFLSSEETFKHWKEYE